MTTTALQGQVITASKRNWVVGIVGGILLLAGTVFGVDWMNYFYQTGSLYPFYGKPAITLLSFVLVLMTGKDYLDRRDWRLLLLAFACMLPTDILMSIVPLNPDMSVGGTVFMIGGVLSIIAHIFLIIRVGRGMPYFKHFKLTDLWLPVVIYGSAVVILAVLWQDVVRVGHAAIAPAYTAFFCTTVWFSWETLRHKLYPATNAWMVAIAATCWYATEIIGEIYNLGLGNISEIAFRLVWVFYGTNVVLWALSGYRWGETQSEKNLGVESN
jgi:hypothetical protein